VIETSVKQNQKQNVKSLARLKSDIVQHRVCGIIPHLKFHQASYGRIRPFNEEVHSGLHFEEAGLNFKLHL
jgi:hypothetical protein